MIETSRRRQLGFPIVLLLIIGSGCELWTPPLPTQAELDRGLIVLYPGSYNTTSELVGFYSAFREAGIDQAIEAVKWNGPLSHFFDPDFPASLRPWARAEAQRLANYKAAYPGNTVTLLGYSAGAMPAIMATEEMPDGVKIDCVILMSPGVWRGYDLNSMMDNTFGAVVYYSPREDFIITLTSLLGTADKHFSDPAGAFGFQSTHERLLQIMWEPGMAEFGNNGDHVDYLLNVGWIQEFVVRWIAHAD